jgi:hypothetical protein
MPRRRPRKVDWTCDSTASDVVVLMALRFGRVDDEERATGPGVGGVSAMSAPRSCSGSLTRGCWTVSDTERGVKVFSAER